LKRNIYFFLECSIVNLLFFSILYKKLLLKSIRKKAKYKTYNFSIDVDDNGIEYAAYNYRINLKWTSISAIVESARYLHVLNDSNEAIFIPKKTFATEEDKKIFLKELNNYSNNTILNVKN